VILYFLGEKTVGAFLIFLGGKIRGIFVFPRRSGLNIIPK
jgi:hypothetical protein